MSNKTIKTIFVDISTLFDLRLGALMSLSVDLALQVTAKSDYYKREIDNFQTDRGILGRTDIAKMCALGRKDLLKNSMATAMYVFLLELCHRYALMTSTTPFLNGYSMTINTYPFSLSMGEQEMLIASLRHKLKLNIEIHVVKIAPDKLTPMYVHENVLAMVLYDYADWVNLHQLQIQKKPLKDVVIYVPHLCRELPTHEQLEEFQKHSTDVFKFAQLFYAPLIAFQYLDIAYYCVDNPYNAKGIFHRTRQQ